jgi:hypothetical protein
VRRDTILIAHKGNSNFMHPVLTSTMEGKVYIGTAKVQLALSPGGRSLLQTRSQNQFSIRSANNYMPHSNR